jgi:hypothetical protein
MHVRFHTVCVKNPSNITVRFKTKYSWDLRHINLTNTQKNYKVLHTRACTSRRITLGYFAIHSRKSSSLTRALNTFFCSRTLSVIETCDSNLVSTLLSMATPQSILFSVTKSWSIVWCRVNGFPLREIQVTTLATLSKQSNVFQKVIFSCSSLLFTSLTTSAWRSMYSSDGLHFCTFFETLPSPRWYQARMVLKKYLKPLNK